MKNYHWILNILIFLVAAGILIPVSPMYRSVPAVDTSVFLYVGQRILEGGIPYRDAWDHKQPFLYLLYALGQGITPGSLWGIWGVLWLGIGSTGCLIYVTLRRSIKSWLSFLSVTCGLLALYPLLWGGAIEEFGLPFHAAAVFFLFSIVTEKKQWRLLLYSFGLGFCVGLTFFLKQNLISAGLAAFIYLGIHIALSRRWRDWLIFPAAAAGFSLTVLSLAVYLAETGTFQSYWDAAIIFNTRYAGLGLLEQFTATLEALEYMSGIPGLLFASIFWITCAGLVFLEAGPWLAQQIRLPSVRWAGLVLGLGGILLSLTVELVGGEVGFGLLQIAAIVGGFVLVVFNALLFFPRLLAALELWLVKPSGSATALSEKDASGINLPLLAFLYFPIVLFMLTITGRNYVYYFIPFIPYLMIAIGAVGEALLRTVNGPSSKKVWIFLLAMWFGLAYFPILQLSSAYAGQRFQPSPAVVRVVTQSSSPTETILVWGKPATYIYILAHRAAPTRYFYQAPVAQEDYNNDFEVSTEILHDLEANPPRLFIYDNAAAESASSIGCPLPASDVPNTPGQIFRYVCNTYKFQEQVDEFLIFRHP